MDIDTAIILAGGLGTRLRPLTLKTPKPLIDVQGRTLTEHVFDFCKKYGIKNIILSLSYMAEDIKAHFGDGRKFDINIRYVIEKEPLGTAGPLLLLDKKEFTKTFLVINGDNLFNLDLHKMYALHKKNNAVVTDALASIEDVSPYGVAVLEDDRIITFVEKPSKEEAPSHYINSGYYLMEPAVFDYVKGKAKAMFEKDVFPVLAQEGKLFGYRDEGQWFDTGTFERYEQVKQEWKGV